MAYSPVSLIGQQIVLQLGVGTDSTQIQGNQDHIAWYLDTLGALFQNTAPIVIDSGSADGEPDGNGNFSYQTGYGSVFTVNPRFDGDTATTQTPQLPYVAQYVGVTLPPNVTDAQARALIVQQSNIQRGGPESIVAAAQQWLTGTQHVNLIERQRADGTKSAYWFVLYVRPEEVIDATALTNAVNAIKPAGIKWDLVQSDSTPWSALTGTWNTITGIWNNFGD